MRKWIALAVPAVLVALGFSVGPGLVESRMNGLTRPRPWPASERATRLLATAFAADLHADTLMWGRDLLRRGERGHVDIPRLIEGHVALQTFASFTKVPRGLNFEVNRGDTDQVLPLMVLQRWPYRTWFDMRERALHAAARLRAAEAASGGRFRIIRTGADLRAYAEQRRTNPAQTAGLLAIEGAQALNGDVRNVDVLYDAGFRMMSPSHFFDTEFGGSSAGLNRIGLTEAGRAMVRRMEERRMVVDLAHASPQTIEDVLAVATRPVVVSHTGVEGTCAGPRNLTDRQLQRVAATGGVIGIAYFDTAVCGVDANAIARAIRRAADVAGADHVALGSDFDGAVNTPFDTTGLAVLVDALFAQRFTDAEIRQILGGNALRVLSGAL